MSGHLPKNVNRRKAIEVLTSWLESSPADVGRRSGYVTPSN
jgi:hypothetical protein